MQQTLHCMIYWGYTKNNHEAIKKLATNTAFTELNELNIIMMW